MFPDLRLLISATVATFFLAATAGLYASLRVTQDQIAVRTDGRTTIEDSPITRIANAWPLPEPGRAAALRELAKIAAYSPVVASEPASVADRSDVNAEREATQSNIPATPESNSHAALNEAPAQDATGSTGIAAASETGAVNPADHLDIQGNIGETPGIGNSDAGAEKTRRTGAKKSPQVSKKKPVKVVQRRKKIQVPEHFPDPITAGYPLYLTVPVFN